MNESILKLLQERYLLPNETSWDDIAKRVSTIYPEIYEDLLNMRFIPSTPTLMNGGTNQRTGTLSSCFPMGINDSIEDIFDSLKECALVTKSGGGIGIDYSNLRSSQEEIKTLDSNSSGPVAFIENFNSMLDTIRQGGKRRGAGMALLSIEHPDILKFIAVKDNLEKINRLNLSVKIPNSFYEQLKKDRTAIHKVKNKNGDYFDLTDKTGKHVSVGEVWNLIIEQAWKVAEPGIFNETIAFDQCTVTNVDKNVICNPSLRKGTKIVTTNGIISIEDLEGKEFFVRNLTGKISNATCWLSGKNKKLYKITLIGGHEYYCTAEHKWPVYVNGKYEKKETKELLANDWIAILKNNELPFGEKGTYSDGFFIGWIYGDGSIGSRSTGEKIVSICVSLEKYNMGIGTIIKNKLHEITGTNQNWVDRTKNKSTYEMTITNNKLQCYLDSFGVEKKEYGLPKILFNTASESFRKGFIDGMLSSDGSIIVKRYSAKIALTTSKEKIAKDFSDLLGLYGVKNSIFCGTRKGFFPNKKNYNKIYTFYSVHTTDFFSAKHLANLISLTNRKKEIELQKIRNYKLKNLKTEYKNNIKVVSVNETDLHEDVWDISVKDETHCFQLTQCITGNCSEYTSIPYSSCNLGSINLVSMLDGKKFNWERFNELIVKATRFIDSAIDVNKFPIKKIKDVTLAIRPLGLGYMGLAHAFYQKGIPFNSEKAIRFSEEVTRYMTLISMQESINLAKEEGKGPYEAFDYDLFMKANERFFSKGCRDIDVSKIAKDIKKYGVRNCSFTSLAPTGTISYIAGVSGGLEPVFALTYARRIEKDNKEYETVYINDSFFNRYLDENFDEKKKVKILEEVANNKGSCQDCKDIPSEIKEIFMVAGDLNPTEHLDILQVVANNVSLSASKTINLSSAATKEEVAEVFLEAHKRKVIGVTVYRDGSRDGILIHKTENGNGCISDRHAPKRPEELPCDIHRMSILGKNEDGERVSERWIVFVGIYKGKPYEIFAGKIDEINLPRSIKGGILRKVKSGHYAFIYDDEVLIKNICKSFDNKEHEAFARLISTSLRHSTPLVFLIDQLSKSRGTIVDFSKAIVQSLKSYMIDGEIAGKCGSCGSKMLFMEGCMKCSNPECGISKCG